jgi:hypothetical protein
MTESDPDQPPESVPNQAPRFHLDDLTITDTIRVGDTVRLVVAFEDPEGDRVNLSASRESITFKGRTLTWLPLYQDMGMNEFEVFAEDGKGGGDTLEVRISVRPPGNYRQMVEVVKGMEWKYFRHQNSNLDTVEYNALEEDSLSILWKSGEMVLDTIVRWNPDARYSYVDSKISDLNSIFGFFSDSRQCGKIIIGEDTVRVSPDTVVIRVQRGYPCRTGRHEETQYYIPGIGLILLYESFGGGGPRGSSYYSPHYVGRLQLFHFNGRQVNFSKYVDTVNYELRQPGL